MSSKKTAPAKGKSEVKAPKKAPPTKASKSDSKSKKLEVKAEESKAAPSEDDEDEDMDRPSSGGGGSAMATLAAASAPTEVSHSFKNFRHHPDMENFYRFIFDNDLRFEALAIIDEVLGQKKIRKKLLTQKSRVH